MNYTITNVYPKEYKTICNSCRLFVQITSRYPEGRTPHHPRIPGPRAKDAVR